MSWQLDTDQHRRYRAEDPVRANALARALRTKLDALAAGDFANVPPNVHVEHYAAELTRALHVLETPGT
ncbi:MAG: hypothetical protein AB7Q27_07300 [Acidimicrobiia bacterium]